MEINRQGSELAGKNPGKKAGREREREESSISSRSLPPFSFPFFFFLLWAGGGQSRRGLVPDKGLDLELGVAPPRHVSLGTTPGIRTGRSVHVGHRTEES